MKNEVKFYQLSETTDCTVDLNGHRYGFLEFDEGQGLWVLWPADICDGVSYTEDFGETVEMIADELDATAQVII